MNQPPVIDPTVTQDDKLFAALGYPIALIAIIALLLEDKKNRPFIKYHAVQSLAVNLVLFVLSMLLSFTVILPCLMWFVTLWMAYEAYQGKYLVLPLITDFIKKQGWVA